MYAVLESGGFLRIGDKLFPVPWEALAALRSEGLFFLNQSKEQMEKAPAFDKDNLPNMTDMHWGERIFKHYDVPGYGQRGPLVYRGMGMVAIAVITVTRCVLVQGEKSLTKKSLTL